MAITRELKRERTNLVQTTNVYELARKFMKIGAKENEFVRKEALRELLSLNNLR